jgi:hypothetical protein
MRVHRVAVASILLLLAACAVRQEGPEGIIIEVDAHHPDVAAIDARDHCDKFNKKAVQVHASKPAPSPRMMFLESQIIVFDCVDKDKK